MRKPVLLGLALLTAGLLFAGGCGGGNNPDAIIGTWTLQGQGPSTSNPAAATYAPAKGEATQQFLADGTFVSNTGARSTWQRINKDTVEIAKVNVTVTVNGDDLYKTIGGVTQHWVRAR